MESNEVIAVIEALANGCDPATGAALEHDALRNEHTRAALQAGLARLRKAARVPAAGVRWSAEEDQRLAAEFDGGLPIGEIARRHGRSGGAITSRLVKIGRIEPDAVKPRERGARLAAQG
jgi:hypothetical protein